MFSGWGLNTYFGYFPENVEVVSFFHFLYSFCIRPFVQRKLQLTGINYDQPSRFYKKTNINHYLDSSNRIFSARASKYIFQMELIHDIVARIDKYYDHIYIDEIQDLSGYDFDLLKLFSKSKAKVTAVGDFFQHTFETSHDGNYRCNLFTDYVQYKKTLMSFGYKIDISTLSKSYRCTPAVCEYINQNLNIEISSQSPLTGKIQTLNADNAEKVYLSSEIVKLFYQKHYSFDCFSNNWGASKGEDHYIDVCVVLNQTTEKEFILNNLANLPPSTKNKLYVAITRSRRDVFFLKQKELKQLSKKP